MDAAHSLYQIRLAYRTVNAFDLGVSAGTQLRDGRIGNSFKQKDPDLTSRIGRLSGFHKKVVNRQMRLTTDHRN